MARGIIGDSPMSAQVSYPPVFPALLASLIVIVGPLAAITTTALLAKVGLVLAVLLTARSLGPVFAALAAALVMTAGAHLEAYSWGAYPQTLAMAFGLLCVYYLQAYVDSGARRHLLLGAGAGVLTCFTHLLVGGLLMFALPVALLGRVWVRRKDDLSWKKRILAAAMALIPGGLFLVVSILTPEGFEAPVNPLDLSRWSALSHTVREAPQLWIALTLFVVFGVVRWRHDVVRSEIFMPATAWIVVGLGFFALTGEARSLMLSQIGLILLAALILREVFTRRRGAHVAQGSPVAMSRVLIVLLLGMASGLAVGGIDSYIGASGWFRVVDRPEIEGLQMLSERANAGDLAIAAAGNNGHPLGWWVEGYTAVPTYSGIDPRWLAFPEEREQAEIANSIFSGDLSADEVLEIIRDAGADYLAVDSRSATSAGFQDLADRELEPLFESPTLTIFVVPGD
jgi:hypothetical protein